MPTPAEICDAIHDRLTEQGISVGTFGTVRPAGEMRSVDALKGDRRVTVHAPTLAEAYRQMLEEK